eukprot:COSAG05_NODE_23220_length_259_cov_0.906250_1_plen_67_part_10
MLSCSRAQAELARFGFQVKGNHKKAALLTQLLEMVVLSFPLHLLPWMPGLSFLFSKLKEYDRYLSYT